MSPKSRFDNLLRKRARLVISPGKAVSDALHATSPLNLAGKICFREGVRWKTQITSGQAEVFHIESDREKPMGPGNEERGFGLSL
jgi:hypothetical protein